MTASTSTEGLTITQTTRLYRVEVWPKSGEADPVGQGLRPEAESWLGQVETVRVARVFLIEGPLDESTILKIAQQLLADTVCDQPVIGKQVTADQSVMIEVHYQPGVMDPVAQSTREAIAEMCSGISLDQLKVQTGVRYEFQLSRQVANLHPERLRQFAKHVLANPVIQEIHEEPFWPDRFSSGQAYQLDLKQVPLRELDSEGLLELSREGHLFLSLEEMETIRDHYRKLGHEPTDIELETLAQTWSEHCVHKTFKATISYRHREEVGPGPNDWSNRTGHTLGDDGLLTIDNLLKSTIAAATRKLIEDGPHGDWCVSVFEDNAGIVKFDEEDGVCIKVETHNHPSAIEPYGGAATGIGGVIRDILGTGLAARPIANTNVFCVAWEERETNNSKWRAESDSTTSVEQKLSVDPSIHHTPHSTLLPKGVIRPRRILDQVVAGVRDYGNRMGIPTVNGAVYFHPDFVGNPLVFAGCVGLLPLNHCFGWPQAGDHIVALGGHTGRDGFHGATFSSAELTDTHADEFSHVVQIGNPITQKKMLDVILQARDHADGCLYRALTDCGAGGFSSAVGEMGQHVGAKVHLERAPLKYEGLSYTEIWISEAQERMVLAVPANHLETLANLCKAEDVSFCDLGTFGCQDEDHQPLLLLSYDGSQVGRLSMKFLHEGLPSSMREAVWPPVPDSNVDESDQCNRPVARHPSAKTSIADALFALLGHPNIASKHWIIRQYDHEVQGTSAIKPLVGPQQDGPSDAAVLRAKPGSRRGIALGCGLQPHLSEKSRYSSLAADGDSYWATLAAIDEAVRNVVCVGSDPRRIALLDNFCWPSCEVPDQLGALVRAAEACYDGAMAYETPFVSGKDSLNNQFTTDDGRLITIPPTLLITALGIVDDVGQCCSMDAKAPSNALLVVGKTTAELGGSHYRMCSGHDKNDRIPRVNLKTGPATARTVAGLIQSARIVSAHDCSDGGLLVAAVEMAFAGRVGLDLDLEGLPTEERLDPITAFFAETPSRFLLEVEPNNLDQVLHTLRDADIPFGQIGTFAGHDHVTLRTPDDGQLLSEKIEDLYQAWRAPLDW